MYRLFDWVISRTYRIYEWYLWKQIEHGLKPRHIGLILDGNRRFAMNYGLKANKGHEKGAENLENVLKWFWDADIEIATIYAFSIENFQRPPHEVKEIMRIITQSFENLEKDERIHKNKVKCLTNKAVVFTKQKIQRNKALLHTVHKILALRNIILPGTYLHS